MKIEDYPIALPHMRSLWLDITPARVSNGAVVMEQYKLPNRATGWVLQCCACGRAWSEKALTVKLRDEAQLCKECRAGTSHGNNNPRNSALKKDVITHMEDQLSRAEPPQSPLRFLAKKDVQHLIPLCTSSIYSGIKDGSFPKPIQLGPNRVAWIESEILAWMHEKIRLARGEPN